MITIPLEIAKQLPISKYRLLDSLYREFEGLPLPLSHEVLAEALELADLVVSSPVFEVDVKTEAIAWKATLMEHADGKLLRRQWSAGVGVVALRSILIAIGSPLAPSTS